MSGVTQSEDEDIEGVHDALVGFATGDDGPGVGQSVVPENGLVEPLVSKATLGTTSAVTTNIAAGQVANSKPKVAEMYPKALSETLEAVATSSTTAYESRVTAVKAANQDQSRTRPAAVTASSTSTTPFRRRARFEGVVIVANPDFDKSEYTTFKLQVLAQGTKEAWPRTKPKVPKPKPVRASARAIPPTESTRGTVTEPPAIIDKEKRDETTGSTVKAKAAVEAHSVVAMSDLMDDDIDWAVEAARSKLLEYPVVSGPDEDEAESKIEEMRTRKLSVGSCTDSDSPCSPQAIKQVPSQPLLRQGESSRLSAAVKSKLAALAERKRARRAAKEPPLRRYRDGFIASDNEEESSIESIQPPNKRKKGKERAKARGTGHRRRKDRVRHWAATVRDPDEDTSEAAVSEPENIIEEVELEERNRCE